MGLTPLVVVGGTPDELSRYNSYLEGQLTTLSPLLLANDIWSDDIMAQVFGHAWLSPTFGALSLCAKQPVLTNEIKSYLAAAVLDDRKADRRWFMRRAPVIKYLEEKGLDLLATFNVNCLADIPYPNFVPDHTTQPDNQRSHNDEVLQHFSEWYGTKYKRRLTQSRTWVRAGDLVTSEFRSPEIELFGEVHRSLIINRERMRPLRERNIVLLNDIYSEEETRFRDRQRRTDTYLNFLRCQPWIRPLVRTFILDKVAHRELAPKTVVPQLGRIVQFCRFLDEDGTTGARQINERTMERYLAWGNARNAAGKNWYTDIAQLLRAAPILLPEDWPAIGLDRRAVRRIKYKQAPDDPRNRLYASKEGANRAAPPEVVAKIMAHLDELPEPIPAIFTIGMVTGARAEDLHAILFDCLAPDPNDDRFMILTFWQNKVSRWNSKPLLKTDPAHKALIDSIESQRANILGKYGRETKYLFPQFYGKRESFLGHRGTPFRFRLAPASPSSWYPDGGRRPRHTQHHV